MDDQPSVLIIARSAQMRNSLKVLIGASTLIKSIYMEAEVRSIVNLQTNEKPALVILAIETGIAEMQGGLDLIKQTWPNTPIIALVDSEHDFLDEASAGVDAVLVKGTRAAHLLHVVESLLPER